MSQQVLFVLLLRKQTPLRAVSPAPPWRGDQQHASGVSINPVGEKCSGTKWVRMLSCGEQQVGHLTRDAFHGAKVPSRKQRACLGNVRKSGENWPFQPLRSSEL